MEAENEPRPLPETSEIQRLDDDTIRRITAEQAISDLSSIVKELMDNALDAESTTIKIRLFGQGLDIIEVSDDGNGVPVGSRPYMATRHATSKIERLEDIYEGTGLTMGFRGEALFAMACVSDSLVVASRTDEDELATKLVFGKDGKPTNSNSNDNNGNDGKAETTPGDPIARKVGTTVAVVKPFANLPARRADLVRRIKQERTRIFKLVEAYGIFNVGVGFRLIDINRNREDMALATSASSTMLKETVSTLLGPAFLKGTRDFSVCLESFFRDKNKRKNGQGGAGGGGGGGGDDDICYNWGVKGLVSVEPSLAAATAQQQRPQRRGGSFGGISSAPKQPAVPASRARIVQYYSINGRVVELPRVTALLKKLWTVHSAATAGLKQKKPSAILEFTLPNDAFDINLSPDKKTVLLTHEDEILGILEEHITKLWSDESSNVFVDGSLSEKQPQRHQQQPSPSRDRYNAPVGDGGDRYEHLRGTKSREHHGHGGDEDEEYHKHKRRFAFVHDISKAKMQHDMAERRASDDDNATPFEEQGRPVLKQTTLTPVVVQQQQQQEQQQEPKDPGPTRKTTRASHEQDSPQPEECRAPPTKKARVSDEGVVGGGTAESSPARPRTEEEEPQRSPSPEDKVSDLDRRKWTEIQSKFSRINDGEANESSTEDHHRSRYASQHEAAAAAPSKAPVTPEDSAAPVQQPPQSSRRPRRGNLQQFAFQSDNTQSNAGGDAGDRYRRVKRTSVSTHEYREVPLNDIAVEENSNHEESKSGSSCRKRKGTDEIESIPSPATDRDHRIQNDRIPKDLVQTDANPNTDMNDAEAAPTAASEEKPPPPQVVWECFSSTEDICLSARLERLNMRKRKMDIDYIRRSIRKQQNGKTENLRRGTSGTSEPSNNEVDKQVAFDDEGDGNDDDDDDDDSGFIRMPKSTFRSGMQVIGQFNLGFILAKCSRNHLWILDQHACDEKYNYEQLIKTTKIHEQPLIQPLRLELTPSEEACVLDHIDIFEANGFRFSFDDEAPIRHRLSLTALPHSGAHEGRKAVQFGPSDVSALCSILTEGSSYEAGSGGTGTDGSGVYGNNAVRRHAGSSSSAASDRLLARLPKAIAMFASRACRTSIMIGTALSHKEMDCIVQKLAGVDAPWNCPHGRPTMRHVANVLPMVLKDERRAAEHIAVPTITVVPATQDEPPDR